VTIFANHSASAPAPEFAAQANCTPTAEGYGAWQSAFDHFNDRLFSGALPACVITYTRRPMVLGYFCAGAFENTSGAVAHEIAMNPMWFAERSDRRSYSTLVHEMCHLARHLCGRPNRKGGTGARGYHDRVWAEEMERVGLVPSTTGAPGGKRTGFRVSHFIAEDGAFDRASRDLLDGGGAIPWRASHQLSAAAAGRAPSASSPKNTRFVCPGCDLRVRARASARLACCDCDRPLAP